MSDTQVAGALDIRNVIAGLIGFYGVVLTVVGLVDGDDATAKTDGFDANLWVGLGLLVCALGFALWSRVRPIVVRTPPTSDGE
jgi:hypothetical protein